MTPGKLAKLFNYSSVSNLCYETNITLAEWIYLINSKKATVRIKPLLKLLEKRNLEIYEESEKKAEEEYWERKKLIKTLLNSKQKELKMDWENIKEKKPCNGEQVLTYDGEFYCILYYFNQKPDYENFVWQGKGFYNYDPEIGDYKVDCITHWARLKEPERNE